MLKFCYHRFSYEKTEALKTGKICLWAHCRSGGQLKIEPGCPQSQSQFLFTGKALFNLVKLFSINQRDKLSYVEFSVENLTTIEN